MSLINNPLTLVYSFALVNKLSISVDEWLVMRDGRSINGYNPKEYMVSKKYFVPWLVLCLRISKLKSPHKKIVFDTDKSENNSYRVSEKALALEPGVLYKQLITTFLCPIMLSSTVVHSAMLSITKDLC